MSRLSKIKLISVSLAVLISLSVLLAGCSYLTETVQDDASLLGAVSPSPSPPPVIRVPTGPAKNSLFGLAYSASSLKNPILTKNRFNLEIASLVYEGLFYVDSGFVARSQLCESYQAFGERYVFLIRGGVLFSDGSELNAKDAAYSLELARSPESLYASRLKDVKEIRATGEYTLEVTLDAPRAGFPLLLDIPLIKDGSAQDEFPPGTGPYSFLGEGQEAHLAARTNWWRGEKLPESRIELVDNAGPDALIYEFETARVSCVTADMTASEPIVFSGDFETWDYPTTTMQFIGFNARKQALSSALVRQAVSLSIDRDGICSRVMSRHASEAPLPCSPFAQSYDSALARTASYAPSKAAELLRQAGAVDADEDGALELIIGKKSYPLSFDMLTNAENSYKVSAARIIADRLRAMGIAVNLRELKWNDMEAALAAGDFDLYYGEVSLTADFDVSELISRYGAMNYGGFYSAELEEKLEKYMAAEGFLQSGAREEFYSAFLEQAPIAPVLFKSGSLLTVRGLIKNPSPTKQNIFRDFEKWEIG